MTATGGCAPFIGLPPWNPKYGHAYVIAFSNGTVKVGFTTNPPNRFSQHKSTVEGFGITITDWWVSDDAPGYLDLEKHLLRCAQSLNGTQSRREYFQGISFDALCEMAEAANADMLPVDEVDPRLAEEARRVAALNVSEPVAAVLLKPGIQLYLLKEVADLLDLDEKALRSNCLKGNIAHVQISPRKCTMKQRDIEELVRRLAPGGDLYGGQLAEDLRGRGLVGAAA